MHLLVVDDEADVQVLFQQRFRRELRARQMALHFARSGEAVLTYLEPPGSANDDYLTRPLDFVTLRQKIWAL